MNQKHDITQRKIFGWANANFSYSDIVTPETVEAIHPIIEMAKRNGKKVLAGGAGHSYGDESLNSGQVIINVLKINQILEWDKISGLLRVQAGATCDHVLTYCLCDNWTLAVIPGTRYVTMGGALSNNVHGKNSYTQGNFGEWVQEFKIILASGEHCTCSHKMNRDLFFAVIGGAGLLGIVTEMTLQLIRIPSAYLSIEKTTASSFNELMDRLDKASQRNNFAIAQLDCFPKTLKSGRGTIHAGSFVSDDLDGMDIEKMRNISQRMFGVIPKKWIPLFGRLMLNDYAMRWVSRLKYYFDKSTNSKEPYRQDIYHFTFLLDQVPDWRHVFRNGFFEYEPLLPREKTRTVIPQLIALTHKYRMPAYLSAIKIHRKDDFLISYSMDGYSFAMDIPRRPKEKEKQDELFRKMNEIVILSGGIVYLAKDANLNASEFQRMYKNVQQFLAIKKKYDPDAIFQSDMYQRLFQK